ARRFRKENAQIGAPTLRVAIASDRRRMRAEKGDMSLGWGSRCGASYHILSVPNVRWARPRPLVNRRGAGPVVRPVPVTRNIPGKKVADSGETWQASFG